MRHTCPRFVTIASVSLLLLVESFGLSSCKTLGRPVVRNERSSPRSALSSADATAPDVGASNFAWREQDLPLCFGARDGQAVFVHEKQSMETCDGSSWASRDAGVSTPIVWGGKATVKTLALGMGDKNCPLGGVSIETFYDVNGNGTYDIPASEGPHDVKSVCNGDAGAVGTGLSLISEALKPSTLAGACPYGGLHFVSFLDIDGKPGKTAGDKILSDTSICNLVGPAGQKGSDGKDGTAGKTGTDGRHAMLIKMALGVADKALCGNGGLVYESWTTTVPSDKAYKASKNGNDDYSHSVVCNGVDGANGKDGLDAVKMRWDVLPSNATECNGQGGVRIVFSRDKPGGVIPASLVVCNGARGKQGDPGPQGPVGDIGPTGVKGDTGAAGRNGRMMKLVTAAFGLSTTDRPNNRCGRGSGISATACAVEAVDGPCISGTEQVAQVCDGADALVFTQVVDDGTIFTTCSDTNHNKKCDPEENPSVRKMHWGFVRWTGKWEDGQWSTPNGMPVLVPVEGENAPLFCQDPPRDDEVVAKFLEYQGADTTLQRDVIYGNYRITTDPTVDQIAPCRDYPILSASLRRHHCHYSSTVNVDRTAHMASPVPHDETQPVTLVVNLDHDHFIRCAGPTDNSGTTAGMTDYNFNTGHWTGARQMGVADAGIWTTAMAVDSSGNVLLTGHTKGAFDDNDLHGKDDTFVLQYDGPGYRMWSEEFGVDGATAIGQAIGADSAGNILVVGNTTGRLAGNGLTALQDYFVTKFTSVGARLWTRMGTGTTKQTATSTAVDGSGNVVIAGYSVLPSTGGSVNAFDSFVAKHDPSGEPIWTKHFGSASGSVMAQAVAVNATGEIMVVGRTRGAIDSNTRKGSEDLFVVKFDSAGNRKWSSQLGASGAVSVAQSVAVDASGNVYVTGYTQGALDGNQLLGTSDAFLVKFNPSGVKQWTKTLGATFAATSARSVMVDTSGNIFVGGSTTGAVDGIAFDGGTVFFLSRFDATGKKIWTRELLAGGDFVLPDYAVSLDAKGYFYLAGSTGSPLDSTITQTGMPDLFVLKFDSEGVRQ